jgi:hypothetical protein
MHHVTPIYTLPGRPAKRLTLLQAAFDAGCDAFPHGRCTFTQKYAQAEWQRGFVHQARVEAWRRSNPDNEAACQRDEAISRRLRGCA